MSDWAFKTALTLVRPVRACTTDEQYTELFESVDAALRQARRDAEVEMNEKAAKVVDGLLPATQDCAADGVCSALGDAATAIRKLLEEQG